MKTVLLLTVTAPSPVSFIFSFFRALRFQDSTRRFSATREAASVWPPTTVSSRLTHGRRTTRRNLFAQVSSAVPSPVHRLSRAAGKEEFIK